MLTGRKYSYCWGDGSYQRKTSEPSFEKRVPERKGEQLRDGVEVNLHALPWVERRLAHDFELVLLLMQQRLQLPVHLTFS
jgi:hypothetical protein